MTEKGRRSARTPPAGSADAAPASGERPGETRVETRDATPADAPPEGDGTGAPGDAPGGARARARAYLDLWERNLVHHAVRGNVLRPGPRRT